MHFCIHPISGELLYPYCFWWSSTFSYFLVSVLFLANFYSSHFCITFVSVLFLVKQYFLLFPCICPGFGELLFIPFLVNFCICTVSGEAVLSAISWYLSCFWRTPIHPISGELLYLYRFWWSSTFCYLLVFVLFWANSWFWWTSLFIPFQVTSVFVLFFVHFWVRPLFDSPLFVLSSAILHLSCFWHTSVFVSDALL